MQVAIKYKDQTFPVEYDEVDKDLLAGCHILRSRSFGGAFRYTPIVKKDSDSKWRGNKDCRFLHLRVAEQALGRPLKSNELVHHIDCNIFNNRRNNLLVARRIEHGRIHTFMGDAYIAAHFKSPLNDEGLQLLNELLPHNTQAIQGRLSLIEPIILHGNFGEVIQVDVKYKNETRKVSFDKIDENLFIKPRVNRSRQKFGTMHECLSVSKNGLNRRNSDARFFHIMIVESIIGRSLQRDEVIHHIDGNPFNCTRRNLLHMKRGDHTSLYGKASVQFGLLHFSKLSELEQVKMLSGVVSRHIQSIRGIYKVI